MELEAIKTYWDYQKSDRPAGHIGMSAIGQCARRLAYHKHEVKGNDYDWRAKIIFDDGNLHHKQIRKSLAEGLILTSSCYSLVREEEEVKLGHLTGHIDGVLQHDSEKCKDSDHSTMLLEVKSMNDRGFQEVKRTGELSKDYAAQVTAYLRALLYDKACVLIKNKNTGEMLRLYYTGDPVLLDDRLSVLSLVLESSDAEQVDREYEPNEDGDLKYPCTYCPFVDLCWRHEGVIKKGEHKYQLLAYPPKVSTKTSDSTKEKSKSNRKRRKGLA